MSRLAFPSAPKKKNWHIAYSAVFLQDSKMADEDDVLPNGYRVIKGDGLNYMIYAMGRMTYLWGEDAEDFRPERWLVNGIFQQESPYKFVSFNVSIIGYSHLSHT